MLTDLEIYRAANQLLMRYGEDAGIEAAKRVDAMLEADEFEGQRVWKRILKAVDELQRDKPDQGDTIQ